MASIRTHNNRRKAKGMTKHQRQIMAHDNRMRLHRRRSAAIFRVLAKAAVSTARSFREFGEASGHLLISLGPGLGKAAKETDYHQMTADALGITRAKAKTINYMMMYGAGPNHG